MSTTKRCFFLGCTNTTVSAPRKSFLTVPRDAKRRPSWFESARGKAQITATQLYCCEDHFDLENDAENWMMFKTLGARLKLKPDVLPRQIDVPIGASQLTSSAEKRRVEAQKKISAPPSPRLKGIERKLFDFDAATSSHKSTEEKQKPQEKLEQNSPTEIFQATGVHLGDVELQTKIKSTQTSLTVKSVGVNVEVNTCCTSTQTKTKDCFRVPVVQPKQALEKWMESDSDVPSEFSSSDPAFSPDKDVSSSNSSVPLIRNDQSEIGKIEKNPRLYTGLPEDSFYLVKLLCSEAQLSYIDVLICMKKIRTNDSFQRIGIDFNFSKSYPAKIFKRTLPIMAKHLQMLIFWPSANKIKKTLPFQFWANYKEVQSIIDCFEIEMQQPSKAVNQASTWSQYKKCNTSKWLISATPNGFVNFISPAFCGRTSDKEIVQKSGYLDVVPEGCTVLADRGFKEIVGMLSEKHCTLARPPSVSANTKPTKAEVRQSKMVASVRIHIERVIRRLREFKMLEPHACFSTKLMPLVNEIVIVACALINMQNPIIKM